MKQEILDSIEESANAFVERAHRTNKPSGNKYARASLNAFFSFSRKRKKVHNISHGSACYGGIGGYIKGKDDVLVNWVSVGNAAEKWACYHGDKKYAFNREEMIRYLSYLARRSPYQKAFLDKNATNMVDRQYSIHPVRYAGNLIVAGMTAERQLWENTQIPHSFLELRKAQPRSNPDWHFLLANMFDIKDGIMTLSLKGGGHCPLCMSDFTMEDAQNFISHNLAGIAEQPFYKTLNYYGITSLFTPHKARNYGSGKFLHEKVTAALKFPNGKLDLKDTLFAWNTGFTGVRQEALTTYSLQESLPVLEKFYQKHFGGK